MGFSTTRHSDSFAGALNEARAASTAGGGTALSATLAQVGLPNGTTHVGFIARNFSGATAVAQFALDPYLLILKTTDNLATTGNVTDYSVVGQGNPVGSGVVLNALDVLANGNALYIGSHVPFRGVAVAMSASVNAVASVLTVKYWNGAWTGVSGFTDGTAAAGATFAQSAPASAPIVWTVPTDWKAIELNKTQGALPQVLYTDRVRFWTQWSVSAQLSATVKANSMFAMSRSAAYAEMEQDGIIQFRTNKGPGGLAAIEMQMSSGTGNGIVNVYNDNPFGSF